MARAAATQVVEYIAPHESPEERFSRLAISRVEHILEHLRILGNLSNRANYRYTDEQTARTFEEIQAAVDETHALFRPRRKREFRL